MRPERDEHEAQSLARARFAVRRESDRAVTGGGSDPDPDSVRRVLEARARLLATTGSGESPGAEREVVAFGLARERYAVGVEFVREVRQKSEITSIPCTPAFVAGATNVRGRVVSVIDLKRFLDLPEVGLADKVMVLRDAQMEFGILVDEVFGVIRVRDREIRGVPANLARIRGDFLYGVAPSGQILIDGARLLADRRLAVCEEVPREGNASVGGHRS